MSDLMDKIGALLLKAERSDNQHEQDAFFQKAQQLATLASIDLESARQRQEHKERRETPIKRSIKLFEWGDKSQTKAFFLQLFMTIGQANDVRFNIYHDNSGVIAFGYPSDIDVTEALYQSLSVQMVAAAEQYLKTKEYRKEYVEYESYDRYHGYTYTRKPMNGRTARRSFYEGFRERIDDRLREAKKQAVESVPTVETSSGSESTALVLKRKTDEISDFYRENNTARGSWRGGSRGRYGTGAFGSGGKAGSSASLGGGGAIAGKRASISA